MPSLTTNPAAARTAPRSSPKQSSRPTSTRSPDGAPASTRRRPFPSGMRRVADDDRRLAAAGPHAQPGARAAAPDRAGAPGVGAHDFATDGSDGVWTCLEPPARPRVRAVLSGRAGGTSHAQPLAGSRHLLSREPQGREEERRAHRDSDGSTARPAIHSATRARPGEQSPSKGPIQPLRRRPPGRFPELELIPAAGDERLAHPVPPGRSGLGGERVAGAAAPAGELRELFARVHVDPACAALLGGARPLRAGAGRARCSPTCRAGAPRRARRSHRARRCAGGSWSRPGSSVPGSSASSCSRETPHSSA